MKHLSPWGPGGGGAEKRDFTRKGLLVIQHQWTQMPFGLFILIFSNKNNLILAAFNVS